MSTADADCLSMDGNRDACGAVRLGRWDFNVALGLRESPKMKEKNLAISG